MSPVLADTNFLCCGTMDRYSATRPETCFDDRRKLCCRECIFFKFTSFHLNFILYSPSSFFLISSLTGVSSDWRYLRWSWSTFSHSSEVRDSLMFMVVSNIYPGFSLWSQIISRGFQKPLMGPNMGFLIWKMSQVWEMFNLLKIRWHGWKADHCPSVYLREIWSEISWHMKILLSVVVVSH